MQWATYWLSIVFLIFTIIVWESLKFYLAVYSRSSYGPRRERKEVIYLLGSVFYFSVFSVFQVTFMCELTGYFDFLVCMPNTTLESGYEYLSLTTSREWLETGDLSTSTVLSAAIIIINISCINGSSFIMSALLGTPLVSAAVLG